MRNYGILTYIRSIGGLREKQKIILLAIGAFSDESGLAVCSVPQIAHEASVSEATVLRVLPQLSRYFSTLSGSGQRGRYQIHLPEKPIKTQSIRSEILYAISELPLHHREKTILKAWAAYATKRGSNIFPSVETISRDTGYCKQTIVESTKWLVQTDFLQACECKAPGGAVRKGFCLPSWDCSTKIFHVTQEQLSAIRQLRAKRHKYCLEAEVHEEGDALVKDEQMDDAWVQEVEAAFDAPLMEYEQQRAEEEQKEWDRGKQPAQSRLRTVPGTTIRVQEGSSLMSDDYLERMYRPRTRAELDAERTRNMSRAARNFYRVGQQKQQQECPVGRGRYIKAQQEIKKHRLIVAAYEQQGNSTHIAESEYKKAQGWITLLQKDIDAYESWNRQKEPEAPKTDTPKMHQDDQNAEHGFWIPIDESTWAQVLGEKVIFRNEESGDGTKPDQERDERGYG